MDAMRRGVAWPHQRSKPRAAVPERIWAPAASLPVRGAAFSRQRAAKTLLLVLMCVCIAVSPHAAHAASRQALRLLKLRTPTAPGIQPNAWELGVSVALTRVEGTNSATAILRAAHFTRAGSLLGVAEGEAGYTHTGPLDALDLDLTIGFLTHPSNGPVYPFIDFGGGVRQEWLGSFRVARRPVGGDVGVRVLAGNRALFRIQYRFRRVLDDPVADFDEHQILSGVSILFGNGP
jgi:hypothetical protein